jgi:two-component system phosphate regulon sensor histidine kinase PhoR
VTQVAKLDLSEWSAEIRMTILLVLFTLAGGALFESYLLSFAAGITALVAWYLFQLWSLKRRLQDDAEVEDSLDSGLLPGLSRQIAALQKRVHEQERYNTQVVLLFRKAFEAFPDAVMILRPDWNIRWCNRAGREMFGLDPENEILGSLVDEAGHPVLKEYLEVGDFSKPLELESPADWARVLSIQLTRFTQGDELVLLVARDITRLYHLDRMRSDFVANVSHELKTPLTVLSGFLETMHLDGDDLPKQWADIVRLMYQQSERMSGIVDDLLMLSRLDAGQDGFSPESVDVPALLDRVVADARVLAQEGGHVISVDIDPSLKLMGEQKTLESLFYNVIINAVHHTPAGTRIDICWFRESGGSVLKVVDSGNGIPARHLPHLTEPFYRVDAGRSRDSGGTGLGLSIVKRSVSRHKGKLQITSEQGKGCEVRIEFPDG